MELSGLSGQLFASKLIPIIPESYRMIIRYDSGMIGISEEGFVILSDWTKWT